MIGYFEPEGDDELKLLQEVYDSGLLWAINHGILHQHGYALGVSSSSETPDLAERLILIKIEPDDTDGEIIFSPAAGLKGYKKYLDYMTEKFRGHDGHEMDAEGEVFE
jgi:hypothetical protein